MSSPATRVVGLRENGDERRGNATEELRTLHASLAWGLYLIIESGSVSHSGAIEVPHMHLNSH